MSKVIKQMEMDALRNTFKGVRDLAVLSVSKLNSHGEYTFRAALRNIESWASERRKSLFGPVKVISQMESFPGSTVEIRSGAIFALKENAKTGIPDLSSGSVVLKAKPFGCGCHCQVRVSRWS